MSVAKLTDKVQFVIDAEGNKKAVQLDLAVWEEIVTLLEQLEDEADERRWDELFSDPRSAALLDRLADEAQAEHEAGNTTELDPETL